MAPDIQKLIETLAGNNIPTSYAPTRGEAFDKIMSMIPGGSVVGFGDSLTLREVGVVDALAARVPGEESDSENDGGERRLNPSEYGIKDSAHAVPRSLRTPRVPASPPRAPPVG